MMLSLNLRISRNARCHIPCVTKFPDAQTLPIISLKVPEGFCGLNTHTTSNTLYLNTGIEVMRYRGAPNSPRIRSNHPRPTMWNHRLTPSGNYIYIYRQRPKKTVVRDFQFFQRPPWPASQRHTTKHIRIYIRIY